ncbi:LysR substrate-binding domain-containing protein [Nocardia nepalensis]|uniref:LysR substrate-binding domain-containing protein n=1 Tax=Nocardia nepalensis TaxID=3375448 RepID=UPI003B679C61
MDDSPSAQLEALAPLLAAFDTTADVGHITRASEKLGVPQSSLSRRLKAVEKAVGVPLFQPAGRGITLTPAGRELFDRTRGLVRALDDALSGVRSNADPETGLVRFGFPLTLGPISMPSMLAEFHTGAPRVRLHLVQAHGEGLAELIRDGRLDLAVMIPSPDDLPAVVLGQQRIHLYVPRSHRLAGSDTVDLADLGRESFIANPPTYHLRRMLDSWCAEAGFTPNVAFEITEFDTMRSLVAHGMGVALLPEPETPHPDLHRVRLSCRRDRTIALVLSNHRPTPVVARLYEFVAQRAMAHIDATEPRAGLRHGSPEPPTP